jgi:hypothetical protein
MIQLPNADKIEYIGKETNQTAFKGTRKTAESVFYVSN